MDLLTLYLVLALAGGLMAFGCTPHMPRWCPLLVLSATPQLASVWGLRGLPGLVLTAGAIGVWCWRNRDIKGMPLLAAGIGMNLLAMAAHGGAMPIASTTLAALGHQSAPGSALIGSKDVVVATSPLWMFSDWMILKSPVATLVVSPGDVCIVVGTICWLLLSRPAQRKLAQ